MVVNDITSSNSRFLLNVPIVFSGAVRVQGYAIDDAFASEQVQVAETMKGVDGVMSAGYTPFITPLNVWLQASSPSIFAIFEAWHQANRASVGQGGAAYWAANATIALPGPGLQYTFTNGVLKMLTPLIPGKKVLQSVQYRIDWDSYTVSQLAA